MPRSASAVGLAKRGVIPRKQFYTKLFFYNTVILVYDVWAEEECGSDGEPNRPAAVFQDVVEEMVVDHIALQADGEVAGQDKIHTTTESVEALPVRLLPG